MEINTVCISTKELEKFIKMQIEYEEFKDVLLEQIEMNCNLKVSLMCELISEWRIKSYELKEITNYRDIYKFGFDADDVTTLLSCGVTIDEMVDFITDFKLEHDAEQREEQEHE